MDLKNSNSWVETVKFDTFGNGSDLHFNKFFISSLKKFLLIDLLPSVFSLINYHPNVLEMYFCGRLRHYLHVLLLSFFISIEFSLESVLKKSLQNILHVWFIWESSLCMDSFLFILELTGYRILSWVIDESCSWRNDVVVSYVQLST